MNLADVPFRHLHHHLLVAKNRALLLQNWNSLNDTSNNWGGRAGGRNGRWYCFRDAVPLRILAVDIYTHSLPLDLITGDGGAAQRQGFATKHNFVSTPKQLS